MQNGYTASGAKVNKKATIQVVSQLSTLSVDRPASLAFELEQQSADWLV